VDTLVPVINSTTFEEGTANDAQFRNSHRKNRDNCPGYLVHSWTSADGPSVRARNQSTAILRHIDSVGPGYWNYTTRCV